MKRVALPILIMPVLALFVARLLALPPFQSPIATPAAAPVAATAASSPLATPGPTGGARLPSAAAAIPPILWIVAGLLLGSAIVLIVRRASPHDG